MTTDLRTQYGGLTLKNPLVVGASNIVTDLNNLIKIQDAGAAAIVYKSLFEEQIQLESYALDQAHENYSDFDAEHITFFPSARHAGPAEHLIQLRKAKEKLHIPLIGSLNCVHEETWCEYAVKMAETGIDALELNFYTNTTDFDATAASIEDQHINVIRLVKAAIPIPVFVKLSPFYTNTLGLIAKLDKAGTNGFVLFNRLFQPDIDVEKEEHHFPYNFSNENDNRLALRYAGLLHNKLNGSIVANTGIMSGRDAIKMMLAGADAVQIVSVIYKRGIQYINTMLEEMETWMQNKGYDSLSDYKGRLSKDNLPDPFTYKRAQYVDILMKSEIFMQYHPKHKHLNEQGEY